MGVTYTMVSVPTDTRINSSDFGDFHYKRFLDWCFVSRQSKAAFLRNVAVNRTEANFELIQTGLQHYCQALGMTMEELQEHIRHADNNGVSIALLHTRLEQGLRGEDAYGGKPNGKLRATRLTRRKKSASQEDEEL